MNFPGSIECIESGSGGGTILVIVGLDKDVKIGDLKPVIKAIVMKATGGKFRARSVNFTIPLNTKSTQFPQLMEWKKEQKKLKEEQKEKLSGQELKKLNAVGVPSP